MSPECTQCGKPRNAEPTDGCEHCGYTILGTASLAPGAGQAARRSLESPELAVGDVLEGKWRVEDKLGEGGMGLVVLARDLQLQRNVAIKLLARHLCSDAVSVARFEREARLTAQLEHPNIVPVYAVGRFHERPFIVMKRLEGRSLSDVVHERKQPWSWAEVRPIIEPMCRGLQYLHERRLVHRDVKPSNVFIGPGGEVTLLDFGILKEASNDLTTTGTTLGTLRFMAPEQVASSSTVDGRADLYSVGVILYRLLAGFTPFSGSDLDVARRKLTEEPPSARSLNDALSEAVDHVLRKAIARTPEDRYSTMLELLKALDEANTGTVMRLVPVPTHQRVAPPPKRSIVAGGVVALAALTVGIGALVALQPRPAAVGVPDTDGGLMARVEVPDGAFVAAPIAVQPVREPAPTPPPTTPTAKDAGATVVKTGPKRLPPGEPVNINFVTFSRGKFASAQLFIDGRAQGDTPVQVALVPGTHSIKLVREGLPPEEQKLVVRAGRAERVVVDLKQ